MAKLTMSKMMVIAAKEDRKAILERVQRYGLVEPYDREEEDCFQHIDTAGQVALFERNVQAAEQSLEVLNTHAPEKKSLLDSFRPQTAVCGGIRDPGKRDTCHPSCDQRFGGFGPTIKRM